MQEEGWSISIPRNQERSLVVVTAKRNLEGYVVVPGDLECGIVTSTRSTQCGPVVNIQ